MSDEIKLNFLAGRENEISPYIFGQNLEHTRSAVMGGISAQLIRNRKFAGKPQKNLGLSKQWFPIGAKNAFYCQPGGDWGGSGNIYTKHVNPGSMGHRNEIQSQAITNLSGKTPVGMGEGGIYLSKGAEYELRLVTQTDVPVTLTVSLTNYNQGIIYCTREVNLIPGDWQITECTLIPDDEQDNGCLCLTFTDRAKIVIGAVSLMKAGHFHGLRADVVENFKKISPKIIRWPGGNFAGEYRWRDGLLPCDQRGPLQAYMEEETQPFNEGFDFHEMNTDDFIALCREVGAEPFITINLTWDSPEEAAAWVEYCNGDESTPMGKVRAERGHKEPYNVHFWSLGNEMGYGHMEGPKTAESYTQTAREHALAMKAVDPSIRLFASGPYPNQEWADKSAAKLADVIEFVSLHCYVSCRLDYSSDEASLKTAENVIERYRDSRSVLYRMREVLPASLKISYDEWNFWYAWYRPTSCAEGLLFAYNLHMLMYEADKVHADVCSYFQAINENLITVEKNGSWLTAGGQAFELMSAHLGGRVVDIDGMEDDSAVVMTDHGDRKVLTFINSSMTEAKTFTFTLDNSAVSESVLLTSDSILPNSNFIKAALRVECENGTYRVTLPAHSAGRLSLCI